MHFLSEAKQMTKYSRSNKKHCFVTGLSHEKNQADMSENQSYGIKKGTVHPCIGCTEEEMTNKTDSLHDMNSCLVWGRLSNQERVALVKCVKHPFCKDDHTTIEFKRNIRQCIHCKRENEHNSRLCPKFQVKRRRLDQ